MRRKDKQISDTAGLHKIINAAPYVVVGFQTAAQPYMVPLDFVFDGEFLYFHCAKDGRKLDLLRENPAISLLFVEHGGIISSGKGKACDCSTKYSSVMALGRAHIMEDAQEKENALSLLMARFNMQHIPFGKGMIDLTCVVRVELSELVGKQSPPPAKNES